MNGDFSGQTRPESDSDDPNRCIIYSSPSDSDEPEESVSLNHHQSDELQILQRESNRLIINGGDPDVLDRLDQYYSDLEYSAKTQVCNDITFTTSAVGLIELSNVVYNKLCEISPRFAQYVSSSMFMYYVTQLHYMRLCCLHFSVSPPDADDLHIMNNMILNNRWIVPQLLANYFNSIGHFKDCAGILARHREIVFPSAGDIYGINGFFGRVDSNTHTHYENRISPGVTALRIHEDLVFTLHPYGKVQNGYWNLPQILQPAEENAGFPTANLLGWKRATALTSEQVNVLKNCGIYLSIIDGTVAFSHCTRFCYNQQLMSYISSHLNKLKGRVQCEDRLNTITVGSIAQLDYQMVKSTPNINRTYVYGDDNTVNCGFVPLYKHLELLAHVFRLRIMRRKVIVQEENGTTSTINPWCCYGFEIYKEVPESWYETSNDYFGLGIPETWWLGCYTSPPADLRILLKRLMAKTLIQ